jgi:hypothetical protein
MERTEPADEDLLVDLFEGPPLGGSLSGKAG